jgi:hypothetical protein
MFEKGEEYEQYITLWMIIEQKETTYTESKMGR